MGRFHKIRGIFNFFMLTMNKTFSVLEWPLAVGFNGPICIYLFIYICVCVWGGGLILNPTGLEISLCIRLCDYLGLFNPQAKRFKRDSRDSRRFID